ncbi:hypothetical protein ACFL1J_06770 [Pseudomonadota bacterium]
MPRKDTQFRSGSEWNGNAAGRPLGSKNKLSESFLDELTKSFKKHGKTAIDRVVKDEPAQYLKIIAGLMPKELLLQVSQEEKPVWVINASPEELTVEQWQKMHGILNLNSEPAKLENNQLIDQKKQET